MRGTVRIPDAHVCAVRGAVGRTGSGAGPASGNVGQQRKSTVTDGHGDSAKVRRTANFKSRNAFARVAGHNLARRDSGRTWHDTPNGVIHTRNFWATSRPPEAYPCRPLPTSATCLQQPSRKRGQNLP